MSVTLAQYIADLNTQAQAQGFVTAGAFAKLAPLLTAIATATYTDIQSGGMPSVYTIPATTGNNPVIAVNWNNGPTQHVLLGHTGTATITFANLVGGQSYSLSLIQPSGGGCVVNLVIPGVRWVMQTTPTQTLTGNALDDLVFKDVGVAVLGELSPKF